MKKQKCHSSRRAVSMVLVALILAVCFLMAGCKEEPKETSSSPESTDAIEETTTEEEATPAPTEPLTRDVSEIRVGMIFYGEENDGSLLSQSLSQKMSEAASMLGMSEDQIQRVYNSRETEWTQIEDSILACVDSGCQLILGCAREYDAVMAAIAEEYPEIMFACVGSQLYNGTNSGTFAVDVAVAQYLCGALAGIEADTSVGFVAAKGSSDAEVTQVVNAFSYGVWSTNPEATVEVAVIGQWFLPGAEEKGRDYLKGLGCEEIGSYTDGSIGALEYQWQSYFSVKLNQIVEKQVVGEAWTGDYYSGAVAGNHDMIQLPDYVMEKVTQWGPELPDEIEPEESSTEAVEASASEDAMEETETTAENNSEENPEETTEEMTEETVEETTAPYEIPDIEIDPDTGYLPNVRIHEISWTEE